MPSRRRVKESEDILREFFLKNDGENVTRPGGVSARVSAHKSAANVETIGGPESIKLDKDEDREKSYS